MLKGKFKEKDKEQFIEYLNFVAKRAKFDDMTVQDTIKFFGLLSYMQKEILPRIEENILEVKRMIEPNSESKE